MSDRTERGKKPAIDPVSGEVHGSGAGAGGGDPGEDYDEDPMGGGGDAVGGARPADGAVRGLEDRHQGHYG